MSTLPARSILSGCGRTVTPFAKTRGATAEVLATPAIDSASLWTDAIDRMLEWRADPDRFDPCDAPSSEILDSAIDYAHDASRSGCFAPTIIVPSGDGRVAFEWHFGRDLMLIEFVGQGTANLTVFTDGKVVRRDELTRDPLTRTLERGG
jgi:hypothetical protein